MKKIPRIVITPGEPAGIGPDITIQIAQQAWPAELIAIADPDLLLERAKIIGLPLQLIDSHLEETPHLHSPHSLKILPISVKAKVTPGELNTANASYVLHTLEMAASLCEAKKTAAIVTGPVHKGILNQAGIAFSGHTEFFAQHSHCALTVMLFVIDQLKIALATTHLPLAQVAAAITKKHLRNILFILHEGLKKQFHLATPRIRVCGLNPHAGENGFLGREEIDIIKPVLAEMQKQHYDVTGPFSADTIFTPHSLTQTDAILAMYHDQALPLVKYIGFGQAVNVTLGLPYIRTSVDHGTALDIAGSAAVDASSMAAAIKLAIQLALL
ncbi:MAG: 4-hydroxythreonine-4-phosphate dehydrogenase PdxA [Gammaproteobacteria bacterium]|nr:4-hydroxythreonine-4-phosphate dehydrogenase PdxA [Gammaproteobacteria bacterium]